MLTRPVLRRVVTHGLAVAVTLGSTISVDAQIFGRRNRDRAPETIVDDDGKVPVSGPVVTSLLPQVNPEAEKMKQEAQELYQKGNHQRVIDLMSAVITSNPKDANAYYLRGSSRVELGMQQANAKLVRDGINDSRLAVSADGQQEFMYYLPYLYGMTVLARIENRKAHAQTAVDIATKVLESDTLHETAKANIYYQRGNGNFFIGKMDDAAEDFKNAIEYSPRHLGAFISLAEALSAGGRTEEAEKQFDEAVDAFPSNPLVYNNRGMHRKKQKQNTEALEDFRKATELNSNYFHAYTNEGFTLMELGRAAEAEEAFTNSLAINTQQPMVYSLRATARLDQGKVQESISDYRHVVTLNPENPIAHSDLGFAKFFAGEYEGALRSFKNAQDRNDKMFVLNPWRYASLVMLGRRAEADRTFGPLVKDKEKRGWVGDVLAYMMGQMDAEALLNRPGTDKEEARQAQLCEAHYFIGFMLQRADEIDGANEHFEQALDTKAFHLSAFRGSQFMLKRFVVSEDL